MDLSKLKEDAAAAVESAAGKADTAAVDATAAAAAGAEDAAAKVDAAAVDASASASAALEGTGDKADAAVADAAVKGELFLSTCCFCWCCVRQIINKTDGRSST